MVVDGLERRDDEPAPGAAVVGLHVAVEDQPDFGRSRLRWCRSEAAMTRRGVVHAAEEAGVAEGDVWPRRDQLVDVGQDRVDVDDADPPPYGRHRAAGAAERAAVVWPRRLTRASSSPVGQPGVAAQRWQVLPGTSKRPRPRCTICSAPLRAGRRAGPSVELVACPANRPTQEGGPVLAGDHAVRQRADHRVVKLVPACQFVEVITPAGRAAAHAPGRWFSNASRIAVHRNRHHTASASSISCIPLLTDRSSADLVAGAPQRGAGDATQRLMTPARRWTRAGPSCRSPAAAGRRSSTMVTVSLGPAQGRLHRVGRHPGRTRSRGSARRRAALDAAADRRGDLDAGHARHAAGGVQAVDVGQHARIAGSAASSPAAPSVRPESATS